MMVIGALTYIYWAYTGVESSTLAGGEIVDPKKNIFKSTLYGFVIAAGVYLLVSVLMVGVMPQSVLAVSETPFPDAFAQMLGAKFLGIDNFWYLFINVAIGISVLGALSGWFLTTARCIYAPASDGYFFKEMAHVDEKYKTPSIALAVSAAVTGIFVIANFFAIRGNENIGAEFTNIITVAAILNLPTYLGTTIAELILLRNQKEKPPVKLTIMVILGVVASLIFLIVGIMSGLTIGWQIWLVGIGLAVVGLPLYPLYQKRIRNKV
ncbi:MAG: APC family permease, partial [Wohlfahrtiimonas sp.]